MSYKNDHELVIANKYGAASSLAKAQMYETYDRLRDITVSGSTATGSGFGTAGGFLWQLASMFSPSSFSSVFGGNSFMNIPGTSYWSPVTGATSSFYGANNSFGIGNLGSYSGFPSGAASVKSGLTGAAAGVPTGFATSASSIAGLSSAAYGLGLASTGFNFGESFLLPTAGLIAGLGGIMQSMAPYLGTSGLAAILAGNIFEGTGSAALSAYQNLTGRVTTNADAILSNKVRNIETVVKMLDTQADIVRQSLKDSIESDNEAISDIK